MSDVNNLELPKFLNRKLNKVEPMPSPKVTPRFKKAAPTKKASEVRSVKPTKAIQKRIDREDKARREAEPVIKAPVKLVLVKQGKKPEPKPEPKAAPKAKSSSKEPGELKGKGLAIWKLISRKGGATQKELCKATGWGQVSQSPLKPICKRMGVKLSFDGRGEDRVYTVK